MNRSCLPILAMRAPPGALRKGQFPKEDHIPSGDETRPHLFDLMDVPQVVVSNIVVFGLCSLYPGLSQATIAWMNTWGFDRYAHPTGTLHVSLEVFSLLSRLCPQPAILRPPGVGTPKATISPDSKR